MRVLAEMREICFACHEIKYFNKIWRKNFMNMNLRSILSMVLCFVLVAATLVGCSGGTVKDANLKEAEYNTTTSLCPATGMSSPMRTTMILRS